MALRFDAQQCQQTSVHQRQWGAGLIAETKQQDGTFFEAFRRINVLARK